jgi:dihydropteroate synthase
VTGEPLPATAPSDVLVLGRVVVHPSPRAPLLMGVVNASPESFSDGREVGGTDAQVERALALVAAGAGIIDVGGESGVTGVAALDAEEEIRRVVPLVERLVAEGIVVSVDTWKPAVARASLGAGAHLVNDVSGLLDPGLADACAEAGAGLVLMHTRARPKHKDFPDYSRVPGGVVGDVVAFLGERMAVALDRGVARDAVVVDPGPDFAKTPAETVAVLRQLDRLQVFERPILLAISRKDFIGALTLRSPRQRDAGTLAAIADGLDRGASILRVHDVAGVADYLRVRAALRGDAEVPDDLQLPIGLRREPTA